MDRIIGDHHPFGLYALFAQIVDGHEVTGMRDNVVWGVYIINFIFFVTLSYSGAFIGGVLHFYHSPWKNAVSRIIEIITVLSDCRPDFYPACV
jgi:Ni/Fe-hydrogenase subunit HybB-like protein